MSDDWRPRIVPSHIDGESWRWTWHVGELAVSLEYVIQAQKWLRQTGVKGGGWAPAQLLGNWPDPETEEDAEKRVRDYADVYPPRPARRDDPHHPEHDS